MFAISQVFDLFLPQLSVRLTITKVKEGKEQLMAEMKGNHNILRHTLQNWESLVNKQ